MRKQNNTGLYNPYNSLTIGFLVLLPVAILLSLSLPSVSKLSPPLVLILITKLVECAVGVVIVEKVISRSEFGGAGSGAGGRARAVASGGVCGGTRAEGGAEGGSGVH